MISSQSRQSFNLLNQETLSKLKSIIKDSQVRHKLSGSGIPIDHSTSKIKMVMDIKSPQTEPQKSQFLVRLEKIISNLKEVKSKPKKLSQGELYNLFGKNCFSWKGELETLGKSEEFIVENMFIIKDHIEGVFSDSENVNYQMAGSFSHRTSQFEIVGLSFLKDKSFKFRGRLSPSFELEGQIIFRPSSRTPSNLKLNLIGVVCHVNWVHLTDESRSEYRLPIVYKRTDSLIYLIINRDGKFMFGNGIISEENQLYSLELTWKDKRHRTQLFQQVEVDRNGAPVKGFCFQSDDVLLEIITKKSEGDGE